jgi:preprotein translocase subunit SecE
MKKIVAYLKDAYNELVYKVSWPTREELSGSTVIVLIASLIIALIVFGMDSLFRYFVNSDLRNYD